MHQRLENFKDDFRNGRREGSVISHQTIDSLSDDERMVWTTIRKELEEIGITIAAFEANHDFIFDWFMRAVESGAFVEQTAAIDGADEGRSEDEDEYPYGRIAYDSHSDPTTEANGSKSSEESAHLSEESGRHIDDELNHRSTPNGEEGLQKPSQAQTATTTSSRTNNVGQAQLSRALMYVFSKVRGDKHDQLVFASSISSGSSVVLRMLTMPAFRSQISPTSLNIAFQTACRSSKSVNTVEILLDHGADVNTGVGGESALLNGLYDGRYRRRLSFLPILDLLLERGADPNFRAPGRERLEFDNVPLARCISGSSTELVDINITLMERLLKSGANPNLPPTWCTFLQQAVAMQNQPAVDLLLKWGAKPDDYGGLGYLTPLHMATENGNSPIMRALLEAGAQVDGRDGFDAEYAPLVFAARFEHVECATLLLSHGANIRSGENQLNPEITSRSPINVAILHNWTKMVSLLVRNGAVIDQEHAKKLIVWNTELSQGFPSLLPMRKKIASTLNLLLLSEEEQDSLVDEEQRQIVEDLRSTGLWTYPKKPFITEKNLKSKPTEARTQTETAKKPRHTKIAKTKQSSRILVRSDSLE